MPGQKTVGATDPPGQAEGEEVIFFDPEKRRIKKNVIPACPAVLSRRRLCEGGSITKADQSAGMNPYDWKVADHEFFLSTTFCRYF
jgi:hypothetical protein